MMKRKKPSCKAWFSKLTPDKSMQAFVLALIIISAYIIFFGAVMYQAIAKDGVFNYDGMKDLTATFGIIVAAAVGYYFGQKNLEEASKTAETATKMWNEAKGDAEGKKSSIKQ